MMQIAQTSQRLAYAAAPMLAVVLAGVAWDADFKLVVPVVVVATFIAGVVSYVRDPDGRWWLSALIGGIVGLLLGISGLFYIASLI
jgi:hypothetical protein